MSRSKLAARCVNNKTPTLGSYEVTLVVIVILLVTVLTISSVPSALSLAVGAQTFDLGLRLKKRLKVTPVRLARLKAA
ncbi:hypothetical protein ACWD4P_06440 [Kitasatospora sp. NPDC002543]